MKTYMRTVNGIVREKNFRTGRSSGFPSRPALIQGAARKSDSAISELEARLKRIPNEMVLINFRWFFSTTLIETNLVIPS